MKEITMPSLSDSMEEGTILGWLKADGEYVAKGEELFDIETDKATMTYHSEEEGVLAIQDGRLVRRRSRPQAVASPACALQRFPVLSCRPSVPLSSKRIAYRVGVLACSERSDHLFGAEEVALHASKLHGPLHTHRTLGQEQVLLNEKAKKPRRAALLQSPLTDSNR